MKKQLSASFAMLLASLLSVHAAPALPSGPAATSAQVFEKIPRVAVPKRPFLFVNQQEIATARKRAENEPWAKKLKENYLRTADEWLARDYAYVQQIIPPAGSLFIYGLGLNLDPVQKKRMAWRGWADPRHVQGANGAIYPSTTHPDDGSGWTDPKTKETYYFVAFANGMTITQLERTVLPALINAYVLTGNEAYAQRALWILDAIATIYPRAYEGPIDYPGNKPGRPDGGRLERPYYQAARALMRYAYFAELLSTSSHATQDSPSNAGHSMLENIELNLLMNGADYCLRMTQSGKGASFELNNGNIDYNRGPLVVGALLGIPEWVDWALNGPLGFRYAVSNTIDINGRYFETGASYAQHTRELLLSTAQLLTRMRLPAYPQGFPAYDDKRFALFALDFFTGIQAAGRLPLFGDAGPDRTITTGRQPFDKGTLLAAQEFYSYSSQAGIRQDALQAGARMLRALPEDYAYSEEELFHAPDWDTPLKQASAANDSAPSARSTLLFDYGTIIFHSGPVQNERATVLRIGPTLNHGQADELNLQFYAKGREFSFDPGYYNTHLRFGFTSSSVAHNLLVVNRRNQLRRPSPGGDIQTWADGSVLRSVAVSNPQAYADQNLQEYKRRVAQIDLSADDSFLIDTFWARGGQDYDYSLHGISQGRLQIQPQDGVALQQTRAGSVLSPDVDYSAELDANGRVASFPKAPFYFAPPGDGYGFLSKPTFYTRSGPARLQWSAGDDTGHELYVSHFASHPGQLITAHSPTPPAVMDVEYALSHVSTSPEQTVRFTSVILPTAGVNKLATVEELPSRNKEMIALRIKPAAGVQTELQEHLYFTAPKNSGLTTFTGNIAFAGEEGYLGLDNSSRVQSASLTGTGEIRKDNFTFSVVPRFEKPLQILKVENQPLRFLVNAPHELTRHLAGSIVCLNRDNLARPYSLRVQKSEAAGENSWLTMDASSNVHAIGVVKGYEAATRTLKIEAPLPRARPYLFGYDYETGQSGISNSQEEYNGTYNGFLVVDAANPAQRAVIKTLADRRTQIVLDSTPKSAFKPGDAFELQLYAPGDILEVPVWGQALRSNDGQWQLTGSGKMAISD